MKALPIDVLRQQLPLGAALVERNGHFYVQWS